MSGAENFSLERSIHEQLAAIAGEVMIEVSLDWHLEEQLLTPAEQAELLSCIREAIINVRKHTRAGRVSVSGHGNEHGWRITVADDGAGIEHDDPFAVSGSYGLQIMRERSRSMGWRLDVQSGAVGTTVEITKGRCRMERCRVLIVDDHAHAREAMSEILALDERFEVIGAVASGAEAIVWTGQWMPDLILIDIEMPGMDGLETTRRIKLEYPYVRIVIVTVSDEISYLFEALKQGAQGYLLKNLAPSTWIEYLLAIVSEEVPLSRELAFQILKEFAVTSVKEEREALTAREKEILGCVSSGSTNKEIAATLGISEHTVKNHLKNILQKLQLQNRTQLTRYALEQGLASRERDFPGKR